jgi:hypothetical protein
VHLLVLWSEARHAEAAIVAGAAASFRLLDTVEIEWSQEHFARSLTRLYGTALPPVGQGAPRRYQSVPPFGGPRSDPALRPPTDRRQPGARRDEHVRCPDAVSALDRRRYRIHASLTREEAERDLFLLLGRGIASFANGAERRDAASPRKLRADPVGTHGWQSVDQVQTALDVTARRRAVASLTPRRLAITADDLWWARQIGGARPVGCSMQLVEVDGLPYLIELREAAQTLPRRVACDSLGSGARRAVERSPGEIRRKTLAEHAPVLQSC